MIIRNALPEEIPFIRRQRIESYAEHEKAISPEHWNSLKMAISSNADCQSEVELIVAEIDGEIVGSVALFPPETDAYEGFVDKLAYYEIRMLAVSQNARGKGVATALISDCIKRTELRGYHAIGLHTGEFMKNAIQLYERLGFKRLPEHDFVPADDGVVVKAFRRSI